MLLFVEYKTRILFLFQKSELAMLLTKCYHKKTGVSMPMNSFGERFWPLKFRSLVKDILEICHEYKPYVLKSTAPPPAALLQNLKVKMMDPFAFTRVDFACPVTHKFKKKSFEIVYMVIFTCISLRTVCLISSFVMA